MVHWAHTKKVRREDFWATVRGTCGLIAFVVLACLFVAYCPEVGVPRQ